MLSAGRHLPPHSSSQRQRACVGPPSPDGCAATGAPTVCALAVFFTPGTKEFSHASLLLAPLLETTFEPSPAAVPPRTAPDPKADPGSAGTADLPFVAHRQRHRRCGALQRDNRRFR